MVRPPQSSNGGAPSIPPPQIEIKPKGEEGVEPNEEGGEGAGERRAEHCQRGGGGAWRHHAVSMETDVGVVSSHSMTRHGLALRDGT